MINILQANLNRSRAAQALVKQTLHETKASIAIISEPNRVPDSDSGWYGSEDATCCIYLAPDIDVTSSGQGVGFVWIETSGVRIYSCYHSPSKRFTIDQYKHYLSQLEMSVRRGPSKVIVAGDLNAHSTSWGSPYTCPKGEAVLDMASTLGLIVCNEGAAPTYERGGRSSHIDVTMASPTMMRKLHSWRVMNIDMASDHHPILFSVDGSIKQCRPKLNGWSWRRLDKDRLISFLKTDEALAGATVFSEAELSRFLERACDSCMPKRNHQGSSKPVHWWTGEIAALRKESFQARRKFQKARKRRRPEECREEQLASREAAKRLRTEIRRSQERCWADLCRQVDKDPWGLPYKIVTKKLIGRRAIPGIRLPGRLDSIVNHLFPASKAPVYPAIKLQVTDEALFTLNELKEAGRCLPKGKAPGPDGVPDTVLRIIVQARPDLLLPTFNDCLKKGTFFDSWKTATLVLLRKGDKPLELPSSYRPLCLINSTGKLFERMIKGRILQHLQQQTHGISPSQFGFTKGRSTTQAIKAVMDIVERVGSGQLYNRKLCTLVSLDVANAFNSAPWDKIDEAMINKCFPSYLIALIRSYFERRCITTEAGQRSFTTGVPQGSVIGPILWNIFYDDLMRQKYPEEVKVICFADDAAIVATGHTTGLLEKALNDTLEIVSRWMTGHGLTLSPGKSTAVMLTTKRGYTNPQISINGDDILLSDSVRYLGVQLSSVLGFGKHVEMASDKATRTASALARLMPNVGGPAENKRRLLATVVQSQLLYAAPVWHRALRHIKYKAKLSSPQRKMALRVAGAYCTVSTEAIMVVTGTIPIHLLAEERADIEIATKTGVSLETAKTETRIKTMAKWQKEWDESSKGRWTHRLIPNVQAWSSRRWGVVNFHTTQFLTGHGCFKSYLLKYKRCEDEVCMYCGHSQDDVEHTFIECDRWWKERRELEIKTGCDITPEGMLSGMLGSKKSWNAVAKFIDVVLARKEKDERQMQAAARNT